MSDSKTLRLMSVLLRSPAEFRDRALMITASRLSLLTARRQPYAVSDWKLVTGRLGEALGRDLDRVLSEAELAGVERGARQRMELLPPHAPFGTFHNGDLSMARLCYAVTRALKPAIVLETGVCYGVTSAFTLAALERNGSGILHSIDLPPLGSDGDSFVGWAISGDSLKARWRLHRGLSRKILPELLKDLSPVSLFVHDSLHTYRNMKMEFKAVWPNIRPGGVLISDDIHNNAAFREFAGRADVAFHAVVREMEKDSLLGVLIKAARVDGAE